MQLREQHGAGRGSKDMGLSVLAAIRLDHILHAREITVVGTVPVIHVGEEEPPGDEEEDGVDEDRFGGSGARLRAVSGVIPNVALDALAALIHVLAVIDRK